jgi:hypothetical protein
MNSKALLLSFLLFQVNPAPGAEAPPLPAPAKKITDLKLKTDSFTFVRIEYGNAQGARARSNWQVDFPDADVNFSFRLGQTTGLKVDLKAKTLRLTDPSLTNYPFIYIAEGGTLHLTDTEVLALRHYLTNGGFLMVDDFWGEREWEQLASQLKRVFPDLEPTEPPIQHPIFHCFYDLKEKPQVPSIGMAMAGRAEGITWERADAKEPHYRALIDKNGRIMAILCHNTDLADGWEREAEDKWYFTEFSAKRAYPMGINIVLYALTH